MLLIWTQLLLAAGQVQVVKRVPSSMEVHIQQVLPPGSDGGKRLRTTLTNKMYIFFYTPLTS